MRWLLLAVALAGLVLATVGCGSERKASKRARIAPTDEPEAMLGDLPLSQFFIEHDRFESVTDPATVSAGNAYFVAPEDEVYGVVIDGRARAYPVPMIAYYHVVNDTIADVPIAVTY